MSSLSNKITLSVITLVLRPLLEVEHKKINSTPGAPSARVLTSRGVTEKNPPLRAQTTHVDII